MKKFTRYFLFITGFLGVVVSIAWIYGEYLLNHFVPQEITLDERPDGTRIVLHRKKIIWLTLRSFYCSEIKVENRFKEAAQEIAIKKPSENHLENHLEPSPDTTLNTTLKTSPETALEIALLKHARIILNFNFRPSEVNKNKSFAQNLKNFLNIKIKIDTIKFDENKIPATEANGLVNFSMASQPLQEEVKDSQTASLAVSPQNNVEDNPEGDQEGDQEENKEASKEISKDISKDPDTKNNTANIAPTSLPWALKLINQVQVRNIVWKKHAPENDSNDYEIIINNLKINCSLHHLSKLDQTEIDSKVSFQVNYPTIGVINCACSIKDKLSQPSLKLDLAAPNLNCVTNAHIKAAVTAVRPIFEEPKFRIELIASADQIRSNRNFSDAKANLQAEIELANWQKTGLDISLLKSIRINNGELALENYKLKTQGEWNWGSWKGRAQIDLPAQNEPAKPIYLLTKGEAEPYKRLQAKAQWLACDINPMDFWQKSPQISEESQTLAHAELLITAEHGKNLAQDHSKNLSKRFTSKLLATINDLQKIEYCIEDLAQLFPKAVELQNKLHEQEKIENIVIKSIDKLRYEGSAQGEWLPITNIPYPVGMPQNADYQQSLVIDVRNYAPPSKNQEPLKQIRLNATGHYTPDLVLADVKGDFFNKLANLTLYCTYEPQKELWDIKKAQVIAEDLQLNGNMIYQNQIQQINAKGVLSGAAISSSDLRIKLQGKTHIDLSASPKTGKLLITSEKLNINEVFINHGEIQITNFNSIGHFEQINALIYLQHLHTTFCHINDWHVAIKPIKKPANSSENRNNKPLLCHQIDFNAEGAYYKHALKIAGSSAVYVNEKKWLGDCKAFTLEIGEDKFYLSQPGKIEYHNDNKEFILLLPALQINDGALQIKAKINPHEINSHFKASELNTDPLSHIGLRTKIYGVLSGDLDIVGKLSSPKINWQYDFHNIRIKGVKKKITNSVFIKQKGSYENQNIHFATAIGGSPKVNFLSEITVPMLIDLQSKDIQFKADNPWYLKMKGLLNLQEIAECFVSNGDEIKGEIVCDLEVQGSANVPNAKGKLKLRSGYWESYASGLVLQNIKVSLEGQGNRLAVTKINANDPQKGSISGGGFINLNSKDNKDSDLTLQLKNLLLTNRDDCSFNANGTITLLGSLQNLRLKGDIKIPQSELWLEHWVEEQSVPATVVHINKPTTDSKLRKIDLLEDPKEEALAVSVKTENKKKSALNLDLYIYFPHKCKIIGHGLDCEWRGELSITGDVATPLIQGKLYLVQGHFDFAGKRLVLNGGTIDFDGSAKNDPYLNIFSSHATSNITARIVFNGYASHPDLSVSSSPPHSMDDTLSYILFNQPISKISVSQAFQVARAAASLKGNKWRFPNVLDQMRQAVGLDVLDFQERDIAGQNQSVLRIGKYIGNSYVGYDQGVGSHSGGIAVELQITKEARVELHSSGAVGVNFMRRF